MHFMTVAFIIIIIISIIIDVPNSSVVRCFRTDPLVRVYIKNTKNNMLVSKRGAKTTSNLDWSRCSDNRKRLMHDQM